MSEERDFVGVTCLRCPTGAEYVPEEGPGTGWVYDDGRGWLCPDCVQVFLRDGEAAIEELALRQRADVIVRSDQAVYMLTGEERPPRAGEDYAIGPYTVGTSDGSRMFRHPAPIVRKVWPIDGERGVEVRGAAGASFGLPKPEEASAT